MTHILETINGNFNSIILLLFIVLFIFVFWRESVDKSTALHWSDMLVDVNTQKISLTKVGQFWGILLSSWIAIYFTQKVPTDKIAEMYTYVFGMWLAFLLGSYSLSNILKTKTGDQDREHQEENQKIQQQLQQFQQPPQ